MKRKRHAVDFAVRLAWQDSKGLVRRVNARCEDISESGMRVHLPSTLTSGTMVVVETEQFQRMGNAIVKYCRRQGMAYTAGLHFGTMSELAEPARKLLLEKMNRAEPEQ